MAGRVKLYSAFVRCCTDLESQAEDGSDLVSPPKWKHTNVEAISKLDVALPLDAGSSPGSSVVMPIVSSSYVVA